MLQKILDNMRKLRPRNVPLGRWCRTDKVQNDIKVDLANMDHCGTCASDKIKDAQIIKKEIKKVNPADIYMRF
jgi:hypothetical protein